MSAKNGSNIVALFKDMAERVYGATSKTKGVGSKRGGPRLTVER